MSDINTKDVAKERRGKKIRKRNSNKDASQNEDAPVITDTRTIEPAIRPADPNNNDGKKVKKTSATTTRISREQKSALAESGRAVYVALPKSLKKRRSAAHTALKPFLAGLQLRGLKAAAPSGTSYFALMFDTEDRRDRAVTKITKASFRWEGVVFKLIVHNFGDIGNGRQVIWQTSANLLASGEEVRDAIIEHVLQIEPLHSSPFEVRQIIDNDMPTGNWAIRFDKSGPESFQKQMKMGRMTVLVTQEPTGTCRFCGNSGHTIFARTTKSDKELGTEVVRGITMLAHTTDSVTMEE